jgi:hypothetical protein
VFDFGLIYLPTSRSKAAGFKLSKDRSSRKGIRHFWQLIVLGELHMLPIMEYSFDGANDYYCWNLIYVIMSQARNRVAVLLCERHFPHIDMSFPLPRLHFRATAQFLCLQIGALFSFVLRLPNISKKGYYSHDIEQTIQPVRYMDVVNVRIKRNGRVMISIEHSGVLKRIPEGVHTYTLKPTYMISIAEFLAVKHRDQSHAEILDQRKTLDVDMG